MLGQEAILPQGESEEILTLLLISDSNLPVGGFVSSSGLESYMNHGFLSSCKSDLARSEALVQFAFSNAQSYANLSTAFVHHLHALITKTLNSGDQESLERIDSDPHSDHDQELDIVYNKVTSVVKNLNELYDSMCLSPVNRRNSYAQGAGFLMLYTKSFAPPADSLISLERLKYHLAESLRRAIRAGNWSIHYPISFAFVTGLLQLSFDRAIHLHMFLHIRSILSAAVRLNLIGPYLSQKIISNNINPLLKIILEDSKSQRLPPSDLVECGLEPYEGIDEAQVEDGPSTSWPFGELIQTRHDACHVRLFNS